MGLPPHQGTAIALSSLPSALLASSHLTLTTRPFAVRSLGANVSFSCQRRRYSKEARSLCARARPCTGRHRSEWDTNTRGSGSAGQAGGSTGGASSRLLWTGERGGPSQALGRLGKVSFPVPSCNAPPKQVQRAHRLGARLSSSVAASILPTSYSSMSPFPSLASFRYSKPSLRLQLWSQPFA